MRADRLLALIMLLQTRGRLTARQLAEELEVSERTIYRDLDALSVAGVPVYTERGHGGGCALLHEYRTTLTGLTEDEIRTLFMLSLPSPLDDLGLGEPFRNALLKLVSALPDDSRPDESATRQRIYLDPAAWSPPGERVPHLHRFYQAVWENRRVEVSCPLPFGLQGNWTVEPYGLVAKARDWYAVCHREDHFRPFRLSKINGLHLLAETFERQGDFDLVRFWKTWCETTMQAQQSVYVVTVRITPALIPDLDWYLGDSIRKSHDENEPDADGWLSLELGFESFAEARTRILGLGGAVEVLSPVPLRLSVMDFARQVLAAYGNDGSQHGFDVSSP